LEEYEEGSDTEQQEEGMLFTRCLLMCLKLDALMRPPSEGEDWSVTASSLLAAVTQRVEWEARRLGGEVQKPVGGGTLGNEKFIYAPRPNVPLWLTVNPTNALPMAGARLFDGWTEEEILPRTPVPISGRKVPAGVWTLGVTLRPLHPPYRNREMSILIEPPTYPPSYPRDARPKKVEVQ
jgi:hypothetical protein